MALSETDLENIRAVVRDEVEAVRKELSLEIQSVRDELAGHRRTITRRFDALEILIARHSEELDELHKKSA